MTEEHSSTLAMLTAIFHDQPELLHAVTLGDLQSQRLLEEVRTKGKLFSEQIHQFVVGRTHAGKTTLGNLLFGSEAMSVSGKQDCTDYIGRVRLKSELCYFDTPGAGGEEAYENYTRMALGLDQLYEPQVDKFQLLDFTDARLGPDGKVLDVTSKLITAADYEREFAAKYPPDAIVYVVCPHMLFLRSDREYLRDMLGKHGPRVVIALNIWTGVTKDTDIENVRNQITATYQRVATDGSLRPRFAEFNALTGVGIDQLTQAICSVIAPEKLGGMQAVLDGSLKEHARRERARHYHRTLDRIAARLALHTVDQQAGGLDLITLAAEGVAQYGVLTFEAQQEAQDFRDELTRHLTEEAGRVRRERTEDIVTQTVQTGTRDIVTSEPVFDLVETVEHEKRRIVEEISDSTGVGVLQSAMIQGRSLWDRVVNVFEGGTQTQRDEIKRRALKDMVQTTTRTLEKEIDVPIKRYEQKIVDYQDKVIATVTEVVGMAENVVGTKALQGAVPLVELLLSIGLGVEQFCTATGRREPIDVYVGAARQRVRLDLDRVRPQLEQLIARGAPAEAEIAALLDSQFAL